MKRIAYTNHTEQAAYVAGILIPPGETRMVDALQVSAPADPDAAPDAPHEDTGNVLDLLDRNVKDITEALPAVSDDDLDALEKAEAGGKTRKGVLEALAAERIRRAQPPATPEPAQ